MEFIIWRKPKLTVGEVYKPDLCSEPTENVDVCVPECKLVVGFISLHKRCTRGFKFRENEHVSNSKYYVVLARK